MKTMFPHYQSWMTTRGVTLRCGNCHLKLADREILILATTLPTEPPSHLVVKEGKEDRAYETISKVKNSGDGKSSQNRCPYTLHCRNHNCDVVVGKVTKLVSREFICFKFENVYIEKNFGEKIEAKKVSKVRERLIKECGIEVVNISNNVTSAKSSSSSPQPSLPMVYCDATELTHTSWEVNVLTRQSPRDYQKELFLSIMCGNTLVYLPTGSGKTLIAAMVLSCMKKLNPDKLMVFLVDRIPLVYQQRDYIKKQLPDLRVGSLVGEMEPEQKKDVHERLASGKIDILVLTHQIFLNFLATCTQTDPIIRLSDVSVLVFDEAHHCQGNHPYNKIMGQFYHNVPDRFKPLVLGLSASPAGELSTQQTLLKLQELLKNLECDISTPVISGDLVAHVNCPETSYEVANAMNNYLKCVIQRHIQHLRKTYIDNTQGSYRLELDRLPLFSANFRGALRKLIDSCPSDKHKIKPLIVGEHIMQMLGVVDLSEVLGCKHAVECLKECVQRIQCAVTPKDGVLKRILTDNPIFEHVRSLVNTEIHGSIVSERYSILERHVKEFVDCSLVDETSRGIVFVNMRKTAYKLCEQIRAIPDVTEKLNPEAFVGHGQGSYDGMTWRDEQELVLKNFKSGRTKLLISTSVLEEGLDVPICNLVVRFEGAATLRALVQTRGRACRRPDSKFVVICDESEKKEAQDVIRKEENMKEAIRRLMEKKAIKSQAVKFCCESRKPSFFLPLPEEADEKVRVKRYYPLISVSVQNLEGLDYRVISFLESNFEVKSSDIAQSTSSAGKEQKCMIFDLQPSEEKDNKEFKSKEEFICHVANVWCSQLTNPDEEPIPVWLQTSLPKKRHKASESLHQLSASSLFLGTLVTRCHFQYEWPTAPSLRNVNTYFDHSLKLLTVTFRLQTRLYKFELRYDELEEFILVYNDVGAGVKRIFLTAKHPPRLFQEVETEVNDNMPQNDDDGVVNDSSDSESTEGYSTDEDSGSTEGYSTDEEYPDKITDFRHRAESSPIDSEIIWERISDIPTGERAWGQCLTFCFAMPSNKSTNLTQFLAVIQNRFQKKAFHCRVKESCGRISNVDLPIDIPFDVMYASQSVISLHPVVRSRLSENFGTLLQSKPPDEMTAVLDQLRKSLEQDKFCDPEKAIKSSLNQGNPSTSWIQGRHVPSHCALIKRAVITPTRLLLYPPEVMVKNRVLRQYDPENFLCVSIRDENLSKLSAGGGSLDLLLDDINRILDEGLAIAGQQFLFLGASNSQLRNHSCWFVGPRLQPDDIRLWMGDFSQIRCVASFMARMGQCFSTSIDTVGIEISQGVMDHMEEDVKTTDQEYTFSDGVGRISQQLLTEVVRKIAKPFMPSALQIRFAGFKGVLTLDPRVVGKRVFLRPSMQKFKSSHRRLEVLQTSRPQAVYLNHQVIMLLSNQGVPDEVFISLQTDMLDKLAGMLVSEIDAIDLLGTGAKIGLSYHSISSAGIPLTTEPFFKSLLVAMYRNYMNELLSRARIRLPLEEARLMMGVMDEIGVLKDGQVFVQYSAVSTRSDREEQFNLNERIVLKGPVVVTRNPCLHPGDVRQLEAVNASELSHLVDCIVFPRHGLRPHPNEMAGGDLDGDLYFVCWDKRLLPRKLNFPPMDYPTLPKLEKDGPITPDDMTKFVVNYIRSDQLGVIDNAHKALADKEEGGIESEICLHFAELHSLAVDAPKTGKWPNPRIQKIESYPDFMMKADKPSYPSENILGKLYRRCRKFQDTASEKHSLKLRVDESFLLQGHDRFLDEASKMFQEYQEKMQGLMHLYGIGTEAEVFTGCFLKLRNRLPKDKTEIAEIVGELVFSMRSYFRRQFFREFSVDGLAQLDDVSITDEMLLKGSAWYIVAYTHSDHNDDLEPVHQKRLLGLPWFVNDVMLAIKKHRRRPSPSQTPDMRTQVGKSLIRLFIEEKTWLLDEFKRRVRTKDAVFRHLKRIQPNLSVTMTGSSATLLFHHESDLDLCLMSQDTQIRKSSCHPREHLEKGKISLEDERKALEALVPHLKEEEEQEEEPKNLFYEVRLVNKTNFPVLVCKRPTKKLTSGRNCPSNLVCHLSSNPHSLTVAILLSSYLKTYPIFLLIMRLIKRWCCVTGISRNKADGGKTFNMLSCLLLFQCMRKMHVQNFNADYVTTQKLDIMQGKKTDGHLCMEWEKVVGFLEEATQQNRNDNHSREEISPAELGEILMEFFQVTERTFEKEVPDPLSGILQKDKFSEVLDKEHLDLVKEHMHRAYQLLALYGDVQIMLAISGSEGYRVIFLNPLLSKFVAGVAQEIVRKTGVKSVIIRRSFPRSYNSAFLEVKGSEPAIRAVEKELEKMSLQASRDRMSGCFVEGASVLLFEGSRNENDHVSLTPYDGPCHQTHDGLARHVAFVTEPKDNEYPFRCFTEKFFQQLKILERDFDPQIHGCLEFAVHFGRVYLFSVPHVLLEDGESVTIAMLRTNKRKIDKLKTRRVPGQVQYVDEERARAERRRRRKSKRTVEDGENKKKKKRGNPSRSSFFTEVRSPHKVKEFLRRCRFHREANPTKKHIVDICSCDDGADAEFYVRFDEKLEFIEIKFPNLRWFMTDVKRRWQQRPDHADDDVIRLDGWETDVRFLLQSRSTLQPKDTPETKYERYRCVLNPNQVPPFSVPEDLWKNVRLIRSVESTKFTNGLMPNLTVSLDKVTEYSRPSQQVNKFESVSTRWEVSLKAVIPKDLTDKDTITMFLREVWTFSLNLSSFVSKWD
ncbi:uncharacterized protein [Montipora capricornis]|uniref:uncharacterized protein isoform X1 n=1 Tax=Montipora capricornis TaxID=246305 RepID=UPI0035F18329